jgi:NADPH:quinone reductase-like Zn-dependent oxidoreductase
MVSLPLILGWDFSGVVEATGPGIARLKAGDEVYSRPDIARDGAYAEYIVVRESEQEKQLVPLNGIPSRIFFENGIPERMMRKGEHR